jgi:hypothetical protein
VRTLDRNASSSNTPRYRYLELDLTVPLAGLDPGGGARIASWMNLSKDGNVLTSHKMNLK